MAEAQENEKWAPPKSYIVMKDDKVIKTCSSLEEAEGYAIQCCRAQYQRYEVFGMERVVSPNTTVEVLLPK